MSKSRLFYHVFTLSMVFVIAVSCSSETDSTSSSPAYPVMEQGNKKTQSDVPADIKKLLAKNTCLGCHKVDKKLVGPAYVEVAKKGYSKEQLIALIKNPVPGNWSEYPPMAPMEWVSDEELSLIADWMLTLPTE